MKLVRQIRFASEGCWNAEPVKVTLHFELGQSICLDEEHDPSYPRVGSNGPVIAIAAQPFTFCDLAGVVERVRTRAIQCSYCGTAV